MFSAVKVQIQKNESESGMQMAEPLVNITHKWLCGIHKVGSS